MRSRPTAADVAASDGSFGSKLRPSLAKIGAALLISLGTANCAQQTAVAPKRGAVGGVDPRYGVAASPRVIPDGQPIPKGGGREMVGKPYVVAGRTYVPRENSSYSREGLASWYGSDFHGRLTANGEIFDRESVAAAHATMPLPSYARVTNLRNGRSLIVRVNDRGPFHENRLIDVSERAAEALDFKRAGTTSVKVDYVGRASVHGSDDAKLMATLRDDGRPAGHPGATALAEAASQTPRPVLAMRERAPEPTERPEPPVGPVLAAATPRPAIRTVVAVATSAPEAATAARAPLRAAALAPLPPERPANLGLSRASAVKAASAGGPRPAEGGPNRRAVANLL